MLTINRPLNPVQFHQWIHSKSNKSLGAQDHLLICYVRVCCARKDFFLDMRVQIILILHTNYYSFNPTKHCTDVRPRSRSLDSYPGHKSTQISLQLNVSLLPIVIFYKCSCSLSFANLEIQFLPVLQISSSIRQLRLQRRCHPAL